MSLCDTCPVPGKCCRAITLGGGSFAHGCQTTEEAESYIRASSGDEQYPKQENQMLVYGKPMPFHPLYKDSDGNWYWWCPKLNLKTGRCMDYENRPECCVSYQPASDPLCVLHEA